MLQITVFISVVLDLREENEPAYSWGIYLGNITER